MNRQDCRYILSVEPTNDIILPKLSYQKALTKPIKGISFGVRGVGYQEGISFGVRGVGYLLIC